MMTEQQHQDQINQLRGTIWEALDGLVGYEPSLMGQFMFMGMAESPDTDNIVYLYKHCDTRRYLNADIYRQCYQYASDGRYHRIDTAAALRRCFRQA